MNLPCEGQQKTLSIKILLILGGPTVSLEDLLEDLPLLLLPVLLLLPFEQTQVGVYVSQRVYVESYDLGQAMEEIQDMESSLWHQVLIVQVP